MIMNTSHLGKALVAVVVALSAAPLLMAQTVAPVASRTPAPLGLLRLKDDPKPGEAAKLAAAKFAIDALSPAGVAGASKSQRDAVDVLALDAGKEWSRNLRGSPRDVSFVSFQLHASSATIVDLGGARLGVVISPVDGSVQLMFDESSTGLLQWKALNYHVGAGKYGGKTMAALPTLTVRLEPDTNTWDLYAGSKLLADNLPLIVAKKPDRRFVLRAGAEGAWLTGLVFADENPLYEDANANGIDDRFELQTRGALLPADTPVVVRSALAQQWKDAQRRKAPPALHVTRPMPDRTVTAVAPKQ